MIDEKENNYNIKNQISAMFCEFKISKHLRQSGIRKNFGYSSLKLFTLIFNLIFYKKNWFTLVSSAKGEQLPGKDAVYRFLNDSKMAWRRFLLSLSAYTIKKVERLTSHTRPKVLIIDDSTFNRNRSKNVELLARCHDHSSNNPTYYKGFRMLTLGWSDGATFLPLDFSLLSSLKSMINGINKDIDKRCSGYKSREEALQSAPNQIPSMISQALSKGIAASYVLMDSWFTQPPLIQDILSQGLDVIGRIKKNKQYYFFNGNRLTLKELYSKATPVQGEKNVLRAITATITNNITVKIVFVRHRRKKNEWIAILSTDCTLPAEEIIRIYRIRWDIEVFFKTTKSFLRLQKEFQGRSYDMLISHTTIVFTRYIILSWQNRCAKDDRTIGSLFYDACDEIEAVDWIVALQQLLQIIENITDNLSHRAKQLIKCQLSQWIEALPNYIKAWLPISVCES